MILVDDRVDALVAPAEQYVFVGDEVFPATAYRRGMARIVRSGRGGRATGR